MSSYEPWHDAVTLLQNSNVIDPSLIHLVNEPFEQPDSGEWLSMEAYSDMLDPLDLGAKVYQEHGRIIIYCITSYNAGTDSLRQLAKNVVNVYRSLPVPRNPFYSNCSIGVGSASDSGDAYVIPVTVEFTYQDIST